MIVRDYGDIVRSAEGIKWDRTGTCSHDGVFYYIVTNRRSGRDTLIKCSDYNGSIYNYTIPTYRSGDKPVLSATEMHHNNLYKTELRVRRLLAENGGWMSSAEIGKLIGESAGTIAGYLKGFDDIEIHSSHNKRMYRIAHHGSKS